MSKSVIAFNKHKVYIQKTLSYAKCLRFDL